MKRIIYSLLFAAGALFAGCSDDDTQAPLNTPIQEGNNLYGVVTDPNGAPVGGIVVSDGFSCVATDANGVYQMPRHADAFHVFYRIPADREKAKDVTNQMMPPIALAMRESEIGLKLFQVMGNHDNCMTPTVTDESSNFDLAGRRNFEYKFGPCDYSFDRGNAHIVAMDDVLLTDEKHNPSDYEGGFTDAQVEWLRQDLSLVPKEKLVIFCVHIPLRNATSFNRETVRNLLKEFDNVHIMAGHTHYAQNYIDGDVYEHIHGAVCGAWWKSTINVDGTPNGYGVYDISGSKIENWYYKPTRLSKDFQIRMYRGETTFAGGYKFTYTASDEIVANIWNSDDRNWKVEVYENGNKTGEMTREKSLDAWGAGYHVGVLSANPDSHGKTTYDHFYHYKLKDAKAAVEIRATDCFGKVYTQNVFTTAAETDYPMVDNYPAVAE